MTTAELETRRRAALDLGNSIRTYRADLKLDLATGHATLAETLAGNDPRIATMRIRDLLLAVPALGATKVRRALAANDMQPRTRVENVSTRRREALIVWLREHHPAAWESIG